MKWIFSDQAPKTTLIDTTSIKAPPGQGCPRCGGMVFAAEQVLAKGREWHRKCFKCRDCTKTLDSIIACDGPDSEVYCKTCYGKKWGPHGYGFACGSGFLQTDGLTWVSENIALNMFTKISPFNYNRLYFTAKTRSHKVVHFTIRTRLQSKRPKVKAARDAVVWCLPLNNNSRRAP